MFFGAITLAIAAWLLLMIDNPLAEWASGQYQATVSERLEREMNWMER